MRPCLWLSLGGLALFLSPTQGQSADAIPRTPLARLGSLQFRHGAEVTALTYSADGKRLASGGTDHLVHLWDVPSGQRVATLRGHTDAVTGVAFFPDRQRLLTAAGDGTVRLWQVEPAKELKKLYKFTPMLAQFGGKPEARLALALSRDGKTALIAGTDNTVRVWDCAREEEVRKLTGHEEHIGSLTLSPDVKCAASASKDASVIVWELATGRKIYTETLHSYRNTLLGVAFSPDSRTVAVAGTLRVQFLDLPSGKIQSQWRLGPEMPPLCSGLLYSHHGHWLLTYAGFQQGIRAVGVESRTTLRSLKVDLRQEPCWSLAPDNKVLAFAPQGGDIALWDLATSKLLNGDGHVRPVEQAAFSGDGKTIFTCAGREVRSWDAVSGKALGRAVLDAEGLTVRARAETGVELFAAQRQAWQRLDWDGVGTPRLERKVEEGVGFYRGHLAASLRGRWVAVACSHNKSELVVWDARTGRPHAMLPLASDAVSPWFSPDDRFLGQFNSQTLRLHDFLTGEANLLRAVDGYRETLRCAAFSADSRLLAFAVEGVAPARPRLFCLEIATEQIRYSFPQFHASVEALAFSPDGRHLLVAVEPDHTVHVLEMHTGAEVGRLAGHGGRVQRLVFSPHGDRLVTASADTTALVWDVRFLTQEKKPVDRLTNGELQKHWQALTLSGGPEVHEAIARLSQHPEEVVPFLRAQIKLGTAPDAKLLAGKIKELDDDRFVVREAASLFLGEWLDVAAPQLKELMALSPSPEVLARARRLLANYRPRPELSWREFRAIEVLEKMAEAAARNFVKQLAEEMPPSPRTREAQAALLRWRDAAR